MGKSSGQQLVELGVPQQIPNCLEVDLLVPEDAVDDDLAGFGGLPEQLADHLGRQIVDHSLQRSTVCLSSQGLGQPQGYLRIGKERGEFA
jgi:hypothetical protein